MFAEWWLAVVGLPVLTHPLPEAPDQPAVYALAAGHVSMRRPCYRLRCTDAEWTAAVQRQPPKRTAPGAPVVLRLDKPRVATWGNRRAIALWAPSSARDRVISYAQNWRVGTRYQREAVRSPDTKLSFDIGTGYRLEPYTDFGTAVPGMVARGGMTFTQNLGPRARLSQAIQIETGRENTYWRQAIGLDLKLRPQWSMRYDLVMHQDTLSNDVGTENSLKLRYSF